MPKIKAPRPHEVYRQQACQPRLEHVITLSDNSRAELMTTALGSIANEGKIQLVTHALHNINWTTEAEHPLHGALYGCHTEIARLILNAGSPVIVPDTYFIAWNYCRAFLAHLPPRPDILRQLEQQERKRADIINLERPTKHRKNGGRRFPKL